MAVVLITRPEPGATQTATRVAALGHNPLIAPILAIQPIGRLNALPPRVQATLLTSGNAAAGCPSACHDLPAFAVGEATANRARDLGFTRVEASDGDAAALAAFVSRSLTPRHGSLFLPTGRRQGGDLARTLRTNGFHVLRHVVYEARSVPVLPAVAEASLRDCRVASVMFYSAETARHFVRLVRSVKLDDGVRGAEALSISERSIVALRELPWRRIRVASKPNQEAMLALLEYE